MKMSKIFNLPVNIEKIHLDDKQISRIPFVGDGGECKAVNHAINNHDALVEALTEVIKYTNHYGVCKYCQINIGIDEEDRAGWPDGESPYHEHAEDCSVLKAINLLDKIKGESK